MAKQLGTMASSTGQVMTSASWLDSHFEAARKEYEAQLRAVGIQRGWHVLDAACGSGSFLPWISELAGSTGRITAFDLAPDNIAVVEDRLSDWKLPCSVETSVGNVLALPYADDSFDAVWFANTSQYLSNRELDRSLAEFRRVVRPGGLVAVKDSDVTMFRVEPAPRGMILRWFEVASSAGMVQPEGALRTPDLPNWLERSGFTDIWKKSTLIEQSVPLSTSAFTTWRDLFTYMSALSPRMKLPPADQEFWRSVRDPKDCESYLARPGCWLAECNVLTVGRV